MHWTPGSVLRMSVPGIGYQFLNNLIFVVLYYVDAPSFQVLSQLKIVATGLAGR